MKNKRSIFTILAFGIGYSLLLGCHSSKEAIVPTITASKSTLDANSPVYVLNSVKVADLKQVQINGRKFTPEDIERIIVLKQQPDLIAKYGPQAKNGVVLITTKDSSK